MGRWFARSCASSAPLSAPMPAPLSALPTCWLGLRLDVQGRVQAFEGRLASGLALRESGRPLADYLTGSSAQGLPQYWPDWLQGTIDLDFQTHDGAALNTRGWLQQDGEGWFLQLLDVSDLIAQAREQEQRRHCLALAGRLAERIRCSGEERLQSSTVEVLGELAEAWGVGCVALAVPHAGAAWQLHAQYCRFQRQGPWVDGQHLGDGLATLDGQQPAQLHAAGGEPGLYLQPAATFLVPYCEREGVAVWLMLSDFIAAERMPWLRDSDWLQAFAAIASALLARLEHQRERHEQDRLSALQGLLGAGWWEYLPDSQQLQLAPALVQELALEQANLSLAAWLQRIHPGDRDELRVRLSSLADGGEAFVQCLRLTASDGYTWYRLQARMLGQGKQRRVCGFLLDISDIKEQQALASAAHARLSNLLASAPAVIYVQSCEGGALQFEYCSESLQPLLCWSLAELKGGLLADLVHHEDFEVYFGRTRALLSEGAVSCRYRVRDRSGTYHWLLDEAKLLCDELGQPREVVGLWLDVTEATLAAERIRESEERYRILVEDSPAMICRYSPDLTLEFANRPLADYLELAPQALVGANLGQWLSEEQLQAFAERLDALTPEQPVSTAEICMQLPGREHAWWVWSDRGVFDAEGQLLEVQAVARDNTEVRKAQQQLLQGAKMATLGEMATGMAHEMNQPLNVMRMAVDNVVRRLDSGAVQADYLREKLGRIEAQVERAARIVDHMRVFGRRSEIEQRPFDPFAAVAGALSLLEEGLRGKGVQLKHSPWDGGPLQVRGFSDQLEQVLINLMVNARDAMLARREREAEFRPQLSVRGERHGQRLHLLVEDNGGGIDPRLLERIFEPFFTTKEVGKGTGLGLSVSYGIVQQMDGELSAVNVGSGARFCIDLPLVVTTSACPL